MKRLLSILCIGLIVPILASCSNKQIEEPEIAFMSVNNIRLSSPAARLYFYAYEKRGLAHYEKLTNDLWNIKIGDEYTYGQYQKEMVFYENLMNSLGLASMYNDEHTLEGEEKEFINKIADSCYNSISSDDKQLLGIEPEDVNELFSILYMASKMEDEYIKDWHDFISEEEYRVCLVQKNSFDSSSEANEFYNSYLESLSENGEGISHTDYTIINVDKSTDMPENQLSAILSLKTNEITYPFIEDNKYIIYEMLNIYDEDLSMIRKNMIIAAGKKKTWLDACEKYLETAMTYYNYDDWNALTFTGNDPYSDELKNIFIYINQLYEHVKLTEQPSSNS